MHLKLYSSVEVYLFPMSVGSITDPVLLCVLHVFDLIF